MHVLMCEVFGEPLPVIDVLTYSEGDYYFGREVMVTVRNPEGESILTVHAPINSLSIVDMKDISYA